MKQTCIQLDMEVVGVVGAGVMGEGVTQCLLEHGLDVILYDKFSEALERANKHIMQKIRVMMMLSGKSKESIGKLTLAENLDVMKNVAFVIENIVEDYDEKKIVYEQLSRICGNECIFMVNTSCIPITKLAANMNSPQNVIGTHFMNPVPMINSVEVIKGFYTSEETIRKVSELLDRLDKESIVVNDSPGFVSNRISHLMMNEAAFLIMENVASVEDVDRIFKECYGHKMGPLETADLIGLDTVVYSLDVLYSTLQDPKFRCCPLLRKMVDAKLLGRKSGRGFYEY